MKEIELHEFSKRDTEMLTEMFLEYLSDKGIHPEIWSFQVKCFIDSEIDQWHWNRKKQKYERCSKKINLN